MSGHVQLRIEPASGRFIPEDERWLTQVTALVTELRASHEVGRVAMPAEPVPGTKGAATSIAVSVVSAGGFTALVELLRSWLTRDRTRSVKLTFGEGGGDLTGFEMDGDGLDPALLDDLLRAVTERVAGGG
jgi:hypothetical protein